MMGFGLGLSLRCSQTVADAVIVGGAHVGAATIVDTEALLPLGVVDAKEWCDCFLAAIMSAKEMCVRPFFCSSIR
jgi:hypothetical protein